MVRAIVGKELRETRLFAALALGVYFVYVSKLTGRWDRVLTPLVGWAPGMTADAPAVPFVQGNFLTVYVCIGVALAIALGFRQSAWEPSQGTSLYLLHLPLSRREIFAIKLLTGIGLLLSCTLLPIVAYAKWAATPGMHAGPFEWSMTGPAFHVWLLMPLAYLGAFASGIRPARWFGTRLLPLVAVTVPGLYFFLLPHWWLIAFPLLLLVAATLVSDIFLVATTRDF
jgi:hypothetical protein